MDWGIYLDKEKMSEYIGYVVLDDKDNIGMVQTSGVIECWDRYGLFYTPTEKEFNLKGKIRIIGTPKGKYSAP